MKKAKGNSRFLPKGLRILYEDRDLIAIHKPGGLLSISAGNPGSRLSVQATAYSAITDYVKKGAVKSNNRIFVVHRLDRDTSGVMLFARTHDVKRKLQDNWDENTKKYLAVVHGDMEDKEGLFTCYLTENSAHRVYKTDDKGNGKQAKTKYKVMHSTKKYSLLDIELLTGRKHQIRVQMADSGHPVAGDTKYGVKSTSESGKVKKGADSRHLALHAYELTCNHPHNDKPITFTSPPPPFFDGFVGRKVTELLG